MNHTVSPTSEPRFTVGAMLVVIAFIHQAVGVVIGLGLDPSVRFDGPPPLVAMARAGVFASVGADLGRGAITWFLLFGFGLALIGLLAHEVERSGARVSRAFAVSLGGLCLLGAFLMPASGFWLGLVPAIVAYRRAGLPRRGLISGDTA